MVTMHRDLHTPGPHWALGYLGKPWRAGCDGPEAYNCWGLVRAVYRERLGVELPAVEVDDLSVRDCARAFGAPGARTAWTRMLSPREPDAVLMARARFPSHVGVWLDIDGGGVLHALGSPDSDGGGAVYFSSLRALVAGGWGRIEFYRHASQGT